MNWSAAEVALVPAGVVTVTSTAPTAWGAVVAVIVVGLTTVKSAAGVAPNRTAVAPVKDEPMIVTVVPPTVGPLLGETPVTTGAVLTVVIAVAELLPATGSVVAEATVAVFVIMVPLGTAPT